LMEPIRIKTSGEVPRTLAQVLAECEREPFFYIDDTEYTIPVEGAVPPALALQAMELAGGSMGMVAAVPFILEMMLGTDGYRALRDCADITRKDFDRLSRVVSERCFGAAEVGKDGLNN
jgi:hypothetical protein